MSYLRSCEYWPLDTASSTLHAPFPIEYRELFTEILHAPSSGRDRAYVEAIVDALADQGSLLHLIHLTGRVIRNLTIDELIIAGDCWDRGPRGDRVVDYLMRQPNVIDLGQP